MTDHPGNPSIFGSPRPPCLYCTSAAFAERRDLNHMGSLEKLPLTTQTFDVLTQIILTQHNSIGCEGYVPRQDHVVFGRAVALQHQRADRTALRW
jgi:hypothetical protein